MADTPKSAGSNIAGSIGTPSIPGVDIITKGRAPMPNTPPKVVKKANVKTPKVVKAPTGTLDSAKPPVVTPPTSTPLKVGGKTGGNSKMVVTVVMGVVFLIVGWVIWSIFTSGNKGDSTTDSKTQNEAVSNSKLGSVKVDPIDEDILDQLGDTPSGYEWTSCSNMDSYFLMPDGWYKLEENAEGTEGCFITKEEITDGGLFQTGLSVNMITDVQNRTSQSPQEYGETFIGSIQSQYNGSGPVNNYQYPFQSSHTQITTQGTTIMYVTYSDNFEDVVYIMWFESPEGIWDSSWEMGQTILDNFAIVK